MAFRIAGRVGIAEGLPQCQPVLLEPIHLVEIVCPSEATAKMNAILAGRRGQILGFDTREGWQGWDTVRAQMAEAEIGDLIIEVRSATAGVGIVRLQVRPHGRTHRAHRRPDRRGAAGGGVSVTESFGTRGQATPDGYSSTSPASASASLSRQSLRLSTKVMADSASKMTHTISSPSEIGRLKKIK